LQSLTFGPSGQRGQESDPKTVSKIHRDLHEGLTPRLRL